MREGRVLVVFPSGTQAQSAELSTVLVQIYILFARAGQRLLQDIDMTAPGPEHIRLGFV